MNDEAIQTEARDETSDKNQPGKSTRRKFVRFIGKKYSAKKNSAPARFALPAAVSKLTGEITEHAAAENRPDENRSAGEKANIAKSERQSEQKDERKKGDRRIKLLEKQLLADLAGKWTTLQMAEAVNLSVSHLHKLFKDNQGTSPAHYLCDVRLKAARKLLTGSVLSIKDIRQQIGIPNKARFIRDFHARYGTTPAAYRRSEREQ
jgi:AraC-like DNA-binding protein